MRESSSLLIARHAAIPTAAPTPAAPAVAAAPNAKAPAIPNLPASFTLAPCFFHTFENTDFFDFRLCACLFLLTDVSFLG
jgi:hypothetical protein